MKSEIPEKIKIRYNQINDSFKLSPDKLMSLVKDILSLLVELENSNESNEYKLKCRQAISNLSNTLNCEIKNVDNHFNLTLEKNKGKINSAKYNELLVKAVSKIHLDIFYFLI